MKFSLQSLVNLRPIRNNDNKHKQYVVEDTTFESHYDKAKSLLP